ncbi:adaptor protein MecA [Butyrivibrio sp. X503]|uniref:adaptor protein MecA n=1 Tax=Butyrivibrio sp. X503 TaxID=2364878 RepID=UPI000EAA6C91|nr:adaptor protein MecA [Butyrivibrio sp. X503]RKM57207.1 adaptor protein MecA [Butyrivibrio sp. X503]
MEFKRIDKETVKCIITEDDMDEQGIKLEDLFEKKKEAMDFLHDIMRKAQEEVDYRPTGSFTPMQITVLPDHTISLTLSENSSSSFADMLKTVTQQAGIKIPKNVLEDLGDCENEERLQRLNEYLQSLKQLTSSVKDILDNTKKFTGKNDNKIPITSNPSADARRQLAEQITNSAKERIEEAHKSSDKSQEDLERLKFHEYIFSFADMRTAISFCAKAPTDIAIKGSLYRDAKRGAYYLHLERCSEDAKKFASLFTMAYEFGHFYASNPSVIAHIKETYECIIKDDAISKLSSIALS